MSDFDRYIVLDFETTGLAPGFRPVEIAWLEFDEDLNVIHNFDSLLNPGIPIEESATKVHGITDEMVAEAPTLDQFMAEDIWDPFLEDRVLVVGHNVKFDLPFFLPYCRSAESLCTMMLSLVLEPLATKHTLSAMATLLGVVEQPTHRASSDVATCFAVLKSFSDREEASIEWLLQQSRSLNADSKLPFGTRRGTIIRDLPLSYRQWVLANFQPDHWLVLILQALEDGTDHHDDYGQDSRHFSAGGS